MSFERANEVHAALQRAGEHVDVSLAIASRSSTRDEEGELVEDIQRLYGGVAKHIRELADAVDKAARAKLKSEGGVRYELISQEEIDAKEAARRARRQEAREAAGFMKKDDPPPPSFDDFD